MHAGIICSFCKRSNFTVCSFFLQSGKGKSMLDLIVMLTCTPSLPEQPDDGVKKAAKTGSNQANEIITSTGYAELWTSLTDIDVRILVGVTFKKKHLHALKLVMRKPGQVQLNTVVTRMHSSRMRTVRCSDRLGADVGV